MQKVYHSQDFVTPFVGVWIETLSGMYKSEGALVTPFVGVWIETPFTGTYDFNILSHPSWVCGLKLAKQVLLWLVLGVTPFVGVWIETSVFVCDGYRLCRHTLRGCVDWNISIEAWRIEFKVTPFVGVWIETEYQPEVYEGDTVTPFVGVWIETEYQPEVYEGDTCHTLRGCVDWNCGNSHVDIK